MKIVMGLRANAFVDGGKDLQGQEAKDLVEWCFGLEKNLFRVALSNL